MSKLFSECHMTIGLATEKGISKISSEDEANVIPIKSEDFPEDVLQQLELERGVKLQPVMTLKFKNYEA